ncbi:MAG: flagellar hook-length control protein FliK [Gammaproteobacteria bacterium]|jgi:flagellar hook-length control protein FliK
MKVAEVRLMDRDNALRDLASIVANTGIDSSMGNPVSIQPQLVRGTPDAPPMKNADIESTRTEFVDFSSALEASGPASAHCGGNRPTAEQGEGGSQSAEFIEAELAHVPPGEEHLSPDTAGMQEGYLLGVGVTEVEIPQWQNNANDGNELPLLSPDEPGLSPQIGGGVLGFSQWGVPSGLVPPPLASSAPQLVVPMLPKENALATGVPSGLVPPPLASSAPQFVVPMLSKENALATGVLPGEASFASGSFGELGPAQLSQRAQADAALDATDEGLAQGALNATEGKRSLGAGWTATSQTGQLNANNTLMAPVGSNQWTGELSTRVAWMVRGDGGVATIALNPAELGPINVKVAITGAEAQVTISALHPLTREAIEGSIERLKDALGNEGFVAVNVDLGNPREGRDGSSFDVFGGAVSRTSNEVIGDAIEAPVITKPRGVVDRYA